MQLKPEEISKIIRAQIKHYENVIEQSEVGTVVGIGNENGQKYYLIEVCGRYRDT